MDDFMNYLAENIKNLGARIKQLDKKLEKRIKDLLIKQLKDQLTDDSITSPLMDYRTLLSHVLNLKMLESNGYLRLNNEEWSIKIMINILVNSGIDEKMDEQKKSDLLQAQAIFT